MRMRNKGEENIISCLISDSGRKRHVERISENE